MTKPFEIPKMLVWKCQFAGSWGHLAAFFAGSWGHPVRSMKGPPAREG